MASNCVLVDDECKDVFKIYRSIPLNETYNSVFQRFDKIVDGNIKDIPYYITNICYNSYYSKRERCIENESIKLKPMCKNICKLFNDNLEKYQKKSSNSICDSLPEDNCFDGSETEKKYDGYDSLEKLCKFAKDKTKCNELKSKASSSSNINNNGNGNGNNTVYIIGGIVALIIILIIGLASFYLLKKKKSKKVKNKYLPSEKDEYFLNKVNIVESSMETISRRYQRFEKDACTSNIQLLDEQLNKGIDEIERMNKARFNNSFYNSTPDTNEMINAIPIIKGEKLRPDSLDYSFNSEVNKDSNINKNNSIQSDNSSNPKDNNSDQSDNASDSSILTNEYMIAKYPFEITQDDEITLEPGDCLKLEKLYDDGWAAGYNINKKTFGAFPVICCGDILDQNGNVVVKMDHSQLLGSLQQNENKEENEQHIEINRNSRRSSILPSEISRRSQIRESIISFNDSEVNIFGVSKFGAPRNSIASNNSHSKFTRSPSSNSTGSPLVVEINNSEIKRDSTFNSIGSPLANEINSPEIQSNSTNNESSFNVNESSTSGNQRSTNFNNIENNDDKDKH
ncbi:hypothetical protein H8356DRAFT_1044601 [Neocallimastix lanati (nom. inval.)]|jgi:ribosomal protein L30/L7E|uniref:SH3 domain-containing protein n=1 Tax=Neocallimastix californiae TaxID=1754190 RepID=A0A1Y2FMN6_9FUNG|nr:hypothetical protein H8356DRAFT_1044601 [Neocallimastix sp. JGI-2020a]ORY85250.1 hypothetical protein LY90DRAFT_663517 [Neocallimastix californiae]|eukprot:ORY85250.1 hypothetical protein LY90DRAFT_663517 [Neocallimastix californiae]